MRKWNLFDCILVFLMIFENFVLKHLLDIGALGVLSILRLFRLIRIMKVFKAIPELGILARGMMNSFSAVWANFAILIMASYILAILLDIQYKALTTPDCAVYKDGTLGNQTQKEPMSSSPEATPYNPFGDDRCATYAPREHIIGKEMGTDLGPFLMDFPYIMHMFFCMFF